MKPDKNSEYQTPEARDRARRAAWFQYATIVVLICAIVGVCIYIYVGLTGERVDATPPPTVPVALETIEPTMAPTDPSPSEKPVETTPAPTSTPAPVFPTASPKPPAPAKLVITKSPLSETVEPGGSCGFTAKAKNYTSVSWLFANHDSSIIVWADKASSYFGVNISYLSPWHIKLSNIPAKMDGWRSQAMFEGEGGPRWTSSLLFT